jgi:hypothetical protein
LKTQKTVNCFINHLIAKHPKIITMAQKKLGDYATPDDDFMHAPITQSIVTTENYEIKPKSLSLLENNQF